MDPLELDFELADTTTNDFTAELLDAMHEADEILDRPADTPRLTSADQEFAPTSEADSPPTIKDTESTRSESPIHPYFLEVPTTPGFGLTKLSPSGNSKELKGERPESSRTQSKSPCTYQSSESYAGGVDNPDTPEVPARGSAPYCSAHDVD
ncbi:hypothetical protein JTB14_010729 [Gonioctena quinquepunctata]|nr:hypothetical protein JTB14_010729 [Gonioctena quinquepunctata]